MGVGITCLPLNASISLKLVLNKQFKSVLLPVETKQDNNVIHHLFLMLECIYVRDNEE